MRVLLHRQVGIVPASGAALEEFRGAVESAQTSPALDDVPGCAENVPAIFRNPEEDGRILTVPPDQTFSLSPSEGERVGERGPFARFWWYRQVAPRLSSCDFKNIRGRPKNPYPL